MKKKFYITTPLYYVNAAPHIGHSYTQIATDAAARFHKFLGEQVFFMTGTDEHGEKIEKASIQAGFGGLRLIPTVEDLNEVITNDGNFVTVKEYGRLVSFGVVSDSGVVRLPVQVVRNGVVHLLFDLTHGRSFRLNNVSMAPRRGVWGEWWTLSRLAQGVGCPEYKELRRRLRYNVCGELDSNAIPPQYG